MFKFILFFLIGFCALPLFLFWQAVSRVRKGLRKTQQQGFGNTAYGYPEPEQPQGKVLSDIEEDVEFEEVEGPLNEIERPTHVEHEDQVTDAEFEEIN